MQTITAEHETKQGALWDSQVTSPWSWPCFGALKRSVSLSIMLSCRDNEGKPVISSLGLLISWKLLVLLPLVNLLSSKVSLDSEMCHNSWVANLGLFSLILEITYFLWSSELSRGPSRILYKPRTRKAAQSPFLPRSKPFSQEGTQWTCYN